MKTIIKWPGGKSGEVDKISSLIPDYNRYIEPFFGGGAVYFSLEPKTAVINDISEMLTKFYELVKKQDEELKKYLLAYHYSMSDLLKNADNNYQELYDIFCSSKYDNIEIFKNVVNKITKNIKNLDVLVDNIEEFKEYILKMVMDKFIRTKKNNEKSPFTNEDLKNNLITGFSSGYYMYFRNIYNDINLKRKNFSIPYEVANFYYIREYCYGSMFRYNAQGEFNIPYGGISYNKKSFINKINNIFTNDISDLFRNTEIYNCDFEELLINKLELTENDFIFLDPPYDTEFSDYEGKSFDKNDQKRLAECLKKISAKFILIIKNTDFIYNLYKDSFRILSFDKNYTYNVRSRNERNVEHLIITNIPG
jgi:DNA adenine methylase